MMTQIICNTGPMIALAGIHNLEILKSLYDNVIVPEPVHGEILRGGKSFTGLDAYKEAEAVWIKVTKLEKSPDPLLANLLDEGEASVIHLARELQIERILMDERKGRRVARDIYNLKVTGTARLLIDAKKAGLISSVSDSLQKMRNTGYWIHEKIFQAALKEAGESD
jgi:uncharacterized protein